MYSLIEQLLARCLTGLVKGYRRLLSQRLRRTCLFRQSCSEFAVAQLRERRLRGVPRIIRRLQDCCGEYSVSFHEHGPVLRTRSGRLFASRDLNPVIMSETGRVRARRIRGMVAAASRRVAELESTHNPPELAPEPPKSPRSSCEITAGV